MKSRNLPLYLAILGLAAVGAYLEGGSALQAMLKPAGKGATHAEQANSGAPPLAVTVARVAEADFRDTVLVTGSLVARDEILVSPEVEGLRVEELKVDEGARIAAGDLLATLTRDTIEAQLAQNDASLARSDAAIAQARSQIVQAEAKLKEARLAFDRAKPLSNSGYMSEATVDQREASARSAEAQLVAARDGLRLAEAEKAMIEAQRRELNWRRTRTVVRSPVDGVVSRRSARVGAIASAVGEPLFRIVARGEIELDAEVTEDRLAHISLGQPARVDVAGIGVQIGKVRLLAPEVDKATRLGKVRVFLGDLPGLRVGSFARGEIETAARRGLAVPASAVLYGRDGASVQLVRDGKILTRRVETGLATGDRMEIKAGLSAGDLVVEKSGTFLRDGDAVRAVTAPDKVSEAKP